MNSGPRDDHDDSDEHDLDAQLERLDEDDDAPVTLDVYDSELAWRPPAREGGRKWRVIQ